MFEFDTLDFKLPRELEATAPPEARGMPRDHVRLMVSYYATDRIVHARFDDLPKFLDVGDVVVINTSGTRNAAITAMRGDGTKLELHLSTQLPGDVWVVELRAGTKPFYDAQPNETFRLPGGASITLHAPYYHHARIATMPNLPNRLWTATLNLPIALDDYLACYGFPIRYEYVKKNWGSEFYQTVYATETGSAEMPAAGRPFSTQLVTALVARGVQIVPLLLHTGVASLEKPEPPYAEFYRVPYATAQAVNLARGAGKRVVAIGTTVTRALETVTDEEGIAHPGEGWTELVITPRRGLRLVNAMLTGFHEPRASHLAMLESLAGRTHLQLAYAEALREKYLWHEFGDSHLILR
jgi:S-adenosylmethionine:tRNA ribosyltransferase-isomerase